MLTETIAAVATPPGEGGIGIIRISGAMAREIGLSLFRFKGGQREPESHRLYFGHIIDPQDKQVVDEVLLTFMRAPRTYTREDIVEINCHGGVLPLAQTLRLVLAKGARLAEPGEFTKRAFLNGRIDLAQAEAVMLIIRAKTDRAMKLAVTQLQGSLSGKVRQVRESLLRVLVQIEACLDFPEHLELEEIARKDIEHVVQEARLQINTLLRTAEKGRILREGLRTVITGKTNVGKSSLLNALLGQERAIVTTVPGTTRDVLEESINIGGIALVILDTAGIRQTQDEVERIGVERSQEALATADLVLFVLDATTGFTALDSEILATIGDKPCLAVVNKADLLAEPELVASDIARQVKPRRVVQVSALTRQGLDAMEQAVIEVVFGGAAVAAEPVMVTSVRHQDALRRAEQSLCEVQQALQEGYAVDFIAIDLSTALAELGEITGETLRDELAEEIFRMFCIGK